MRFNLAELVYDSYVRDICVSRDTSVLDDVFAHAERDPDLDPRDFLRIARLVSFVKAYMEDRPSSEVLL